MTTVIKKIYTIIVTDIKKVAFFCIGKCPGETGIILRKLIYSRLFAECGEKLRIHNSFNVENPRNIFIGDRFWVNHHCEFNGNGTIYIGDDVWIGMNTTLITSNHIFSSNEKTICSQGMKNYSTLIGNDVWIGANVTLLPNIKIGNGAVIGAGSVVTKNCGDYEIIAGNPAKNIGYR